jgi:hypothetical protein
VKTLLFLGFGWIAIKYAGCGIADVAVIGWFLTSPGTYRAIMGFSHLSTAR